MKTLTIITLMLIVSVSAMAQSTIKGSNRTGTLKVGTDTSKSYFGDSSPFGTEMLSNIVTLYSTSTLLTIKPIDNRSDYQKGAIITVRKSQTEWLNDSTLVIHPVIK
ncbi:MAG: hypothetical protein JWQ09_5852 [Segetibacter sp.]|nr:hypothetical protein [Segetibacter sp.]